MPDGDHPTGARVPNGNEANVVPADLSRFREDLTDNFVYPAVDAADRDARLSDLPAGSLVSCAPLKTVWLKLTDPPAAAAWATVAEDTGWLTTGITYPTSDWEAGSVAKYRRLNGRVSFRANLLYAGATLTPFSYGNITDATVLKIPEAYAPDENDHYIQASVQSIYASVYVNTNGDVRIGAVTPGYNLTEGANLYIAGSWAAK